MDLCRRRWSLGRLVCSAVVMLAAMPSHAAATLDSQVHSARPAESTGIALRPLIACRGQRRLCPYFHSPPRLYSYLAGQPVRPLLTGNAYAIDAGVWYSYGHLRLSVEWLSPTARVLARGDAFTFPDAMAGALAIARVCARAPGATTCATLRAPEAVRTAATYLAYACGSRRPPAPPYDPDFAFLSTPRPIEGWNPCAPVTWAIDEYGEPPLDASGGATWQSVASTAVGQLASATGIEFVETPSYQLAPGSAFATRPSGVDIGITFQPLEAGTGGLGGPTAGHGQFITAGGVEINSNAYWDVPDATDAVLHELGHAMGLAHPVAEPPAFDPKNAVMDPAETLFLSYQPGDMCGLYEAVWRAPCARTTAVTLGQGVVAQ
jgi:hypothetical protein